LRADFGKSSYNVRVTPDELWSRVGRVLKEERERRRQSLTQVGHAAGIDPNTVKSIERGEWGTKTTVTRHAAAFGMSIVDIIAGVLKATEQPPSREAITVLRLFEDLPVDDRQLVLQTIQRVAEQAEARRKLEALVAELRSTVAPAADPRRTKPKTR
jgi:transcriptional regulator with XRE-family HTH domain